MSKNKKVMSIAILPDLHDELKRYAKRKAISASVYATNLIEQAVKLNIDDDPMVIGKPVDEDVTPVVLKVPTALRSDADRLQQWMTAQGNALVKAMTAKPQA